MQRTTMKHVNDALACLNLHLGVKPGEKGSFSIQGAYGGGELQRPAACGGGLLNGTGFSPSCRVTRDLAFRCPIRGRRGSGPRVAPARTLW